MSATRRINIPLSVLLTSSLAEASGALPLLVIDTSAVKLQLAVIVITAINSLTYFISFNFIDESCIKTKFLKISKILLFSRT